MNRDGVWMQQKETEINNKYRNGSMLYSINCGVNYGENYMAPFVVPIDRNRQRGSLTPDSDWRCRAGVLWECGGSAVEAERGRKRENSKRHTRKNPANERRNPWKAMEG